MRDFGLVDNFQNPSRIFVAEVMNSLILSELQTNTCIDGMVGSIAVTKEGFIIYEAR